MPALGSSDGIIIDRPRFATSACVEPVAEHLTRNADELICAENDHSPYWYRVLTGAARCCTHLNDGRRRVIDFLIPGDMFRVYALPVHRIRLEAVVTPTLVHRYRRLELEQIARFDRAVAREMREEAPRAIERLQAHTVMLGHSSAIERVAAFLLEFSRRSRPQPEDTLVLPMSRSDVADYLGIAVESVSRALTHLRRDGIIDLEGPKRVRIKSRPALEQLAVQVLDA